MREIAQWKIERVKEIMEKINTNNVIGIANIEGIPAPQIQQIRQKLRDKADIMVSKNKFLDLALKEATKNKKGIDKLIDIIDGQSALVTTNINPFKLFRETEETKTKTRAKGGEIAPRDIEVKAGETPFKPGPIVGELQKAGVPAKITGGRVVITRDKMMVKSGEKIPIEIAKALTRLEIYPLTIGLDLRGVYQDETIYTRDILKIDKNTYINNLRLATKEAIDLSIHIGYIAPLTIKTLLSRAHNQALNLAIETKTPTRDTINILLNQAKTQMLSLSTKIPNALDNKLKKQE